MWLEGSPISQDGEAVPQVWKVHSEGRATKAWAMTTHEKLPPERRGITHKFTINGHLKGCVTANCYPDGRLAEVFLTVHRVGGLERGMCSALAIMISTALQHGVPLQKVVDKLKGMTFEPQGLTGNKTIPLCKSLADYLGRWLEGKFLEPKKKEFEYAKLGGGERNHNGH